ncbi:SMI1/KNR4 family protein [Streptomyces longispororuber]|uniref:SMI1/KNR4 family protein n=1 Tax=Streptomyces longispororuber TaxID=68230 RepID=UPI0033F07289
MADRRNAEELGAHVIAAWDRIERWLHAHAPASAALLRPAAGDADIAAAEAAMGVVLPPALAAWYRLHDGIEEDGAADVAGILPSGKTMLPLGVLIEEYRMHTKDWEREAGILPFARTPGDTWSGWYVDARDGEPSYGNLGTWAVDLGDDPYPSSYGWPVADWLGEMAAALEEGRCLRHPDGTADRHDWPVLTATGGLTWVDPRDPRLFPKGGIVLDGPRPSP